MAQQLIDAFSADWDAEKYTDDYRHNLMKIVEAKKARATPDLVEEADPQSARVVDLMERLRQSLGTRRAETAKAAKSTKAGRARKGRKPSARKPSRRRAA
jgi:DNA end-binding protein Ku